MKILIKSNINAGYESPYKQPHKKPVVLKQTRGFKNINKDAIMKIDIYA